MVSVIPLRRIFRAVFAHEEFPLLWTVQKQGQGFSDQGFWRWQMFRITDDGIEEIGGYLPDGFLNGLGIFETMRILYEKDCNIIRAENLAEHYRRLLAGKEELGLTGEFSLRRLENALSALIRTRGIRFGSVSVYIVADRYPHAEFLISHDSREIESSMALHAARRDGADEIIFLNTDNYVAQCCQANIFWQMKRIIYTPSISAGIVAGVARQKTIDRYQARGYIIKEGLFELNDLYLADRIFLVSAILNEMPAQIVR